MLPQHKFILYGVFVIIVLLIDRIVYGLQHTSNSMRTAIITNTTTNKNKNNKSNTSNNSNNNNDDDNNSSNSNGKMLWNKSAISATALVAGTTVGAGILALPQVSSSSGFIYSSIALLCSWIYMLSSSLLIAEVSCNLVRRDTANDGIGLIAMVEKVLGSKVSIFASFSYVFIHYALLVAYISQGGEILSSSLCINKSIGTVLFPIFIGSILASNRKELIECTNNFFALLALLSFTIISALGLPSVKIANLLSSDMTSIWKTIPVMLVASLLIMIIYKALVFHNIVPTVAKQLDYDTKSITNVLTVGSFIPCLMFLLWNFVILGIRSASLTSGVDFDPISLMSSSYTGFTSSLISFLVSLFSESAIITSFIGFVIGLLSFFNDITTKLSKSKSSNNDIHANRSSTGMMSIKNENILKYLLILIPPTMVALCTPNIFINALDFAGTYGITILFAIIPALLALKLRIDFKCNAEADADMAVNNEIIIDSKWISYENFVIGGDTAVYAILLLALVVIVR